MSITRGGNVGVGTTAPEPYGCAVLYYAYSVNLY